jgi:hypothetical protein
MTLNFPDTPSTGDIYTDSTSGFSYEWNGTVWISTDPARAANIKELDDISGSFNGSTATFNLTVSSAGVSPVTAQQLLISVGGVIGETPALLTVKLNVAVEPLNEPDISSSSLMLAALAGSVLIHTVPFHS